MRLTSETKVGILVIAAVIGLGWMTVKSGSLGGGLNTEGTRKLESAFSNVDGIIVGTPVKMAGVQVGQVSQIELKSTGEAVIHFKVKENVPLPSNVKAAIDSTGIIGDKFVALTTDFAPEGALGKAVKRIPSASTAAPEDIADNFAKVSDDLEEVTKSLRSALGGPEGAAKLQQIINGLSTFSANLESDSDVIFSDLKESVSSLRKILSSNEDQAQGMIGNFSVTAENLAKITTRLEKGEGTLGKLLNGDGDETGDLLADLQAAAKDMKEIAAKINGGEGSLGQLVNDSTTVERLNDALDGLSGATDRLNSFQTTVDFNAYSLMAEPSVGKGEFSVTLQPRPTRFYVLGVTADGFASEADNSNVGGDFFGREFGEDIKFTAQFGHVFEDLILDQDIAVRVGLKDSTAGIGADTKLAFFGHFVDVSADLYDFSGENTDRSNTPHLDFKAKVNLLDNNLYAMAGYDNILNPDYGSPIVGLGFRFQDDDLKYLVGSAL